MQCQLNEVLWPKQMCMADFLNYLSTYVTVINKNNNNSIDIDLAAAIKNAQGIGAQDEK